VRHPYDWYPATDLAVLERVCEQWLTSAAHHGAVVEVGSWTGQSAEVIVQYAPDLICVDPWDGRTFNKAGEAYTLFKQNLPSVARFRCGWREFAEVFDGPLAFCHIDAVHEYDDVRENILAFKPLLIPGGVLCGHDANDGRFPGLTAAVADTLPHAQSEEHVWWWTKP
jgi:hypothetical protein